MRRWTGVCRAQEGSTGLAGGEAQGLLPPALLGGSSRCFKQRCTVFRQVRRGLWFLVNGVPWWNILLVLRLFLRAENSIR